MAIIGVTFMEFKVALVTVNVVARDTPLYVAEMTLLPAATDVANPLKPDTLFIVAMAGLAESQVTNPVMFWAV